MRLADADRDVAASVAMNAWPAAFAARKSMPTRQRRGGRSVYVGLEPAGGRWLRLDASAGSALVRAEAGVSLDHDRGGLRVRARDGREDLASGVDDAAVGKVVRLVGSTANGAGGLPPKRGGSPHDAAKQPVGRRADDRRRRPNDAADGTAGALAASAAVADRGGRHRAEALVCADDGEANASAGSVAAWYPALRSASTCRARTGDRRRSAGVRDLAHQTGHQRK